MSEVLFERAEKLISGGVNSPARSFGRRLSNSDFHRQKRNYGDGCALGKVYQAGAFSGNSISVTAGLATLRTIKNREKAFYCELDDKRQQLCDAIRDFEDESYPVQVNDFASMFQILSDASVYYYEAARKADKEKFMNFYRKLLEKGIFLSPSQFETCFMLAAHLKADVAKTVEAIRVSRLLNEENVSVAFNLNLDDCNKLRC